MTRPRLLDAYCGAGGCAVGYHRAGFDVVGVDIEPQKHYPFEFVQADAIKYIREHGHEFDVIHASPPCQRYSVTHAIRGNEHPDLIGATRQVIQSTGKPYVIENVPGSPLVNPVMLCGMYFSLHVYRHRLFETNPWMLSPPHWSHKDNTPRAGRGVSSKGFISVAGDTGMVDYCRYAMGIDWMTGSELSQAIPPAYTEWLGRQLLAALEADR